MQTIIKSIKYANDRTKIQSLIKRLVIDKLKLSKVSEDKNPFKVTLSDGKEYWIFVDVLTTDYNINDRSRVEISKMPEYDKCINDTDTPFVLLGYDIERDLFVVWNPALVKPLLNRNVKSSLLSITSEQKRLYNLKKKRVIDFTFNDGNKVYCVPRQKIGEFLNDLPLKFDNIYGWIEPAPSMGADEAYRIFRNIDVNMSEFVKYLKSEGYINNGIGNKKSHVNKFFHEGFIKTHEDIFLKYESLTEYGKALDEFFKAGDVMAFMKGYGYLYCASLRKYLDFLTWKIYESGITDCAVIEGRDSARFGKHDLLYVDIYENSGLPQEECRIQRRRSLDTFVEIIFLIGFEKVAELKLVGWGGHDGMPLLTKEPEKYTADYYSECDNGWFVYSNNTVKKKAETLNKIADTLHLRFHADYIHANNVRAKEKGEE